MDRDAQGSLFPEYPDVPGARPTDTSMAAADAVAETAEDLRERALKELRRAAFGLTADEVASNLGVDKLSIRPRCSELRKKGLIDDSGERRKNDSGHKAIVWIIKEVPIARL